MLRHLARVLCVATELPLYLPRRESTDAADQLEPANSAIRFLYDTVIRLRHLLGTRVERTVFPFVVAHMIE